MCATRVPYFMYSAEQVAGMSPSENLDFQRGGLGTLPIPKKPSFSPISADFVEVRAVQRFSHLRTDSFTVAKPGTWNNGGFD